MPGKAFWDELEQKHDRPHLKGFVHCSALLSQLDLKSALLLMLTLCMSSFSYGEKRNTASALVIGSVHAITNRQWMFGNESTSQDPRAKSRLLGIHV